MLSIIHISLQSQRPRHVIHLRHVVPIQLQRAKELVEPQTRVSGDLGDADRRAWRLEGRGDNDAGDMVDGDHVDGVVDVRAGIELDAALEHADEEVVGVGGCFVSTWFLGGGMVRYLLPVVESPRT